MQADDSEFIFVNDSPKLLPAREIIENPFSVSQTFILGDRQEAGSMKRLEHQSQSPEPLQLRVDELIHGGKDQKNEARYFNHDDDQEDMQRSLPDIRTRRRTKTIDNGQASRRNQLEYQEFQTQLMNRGYSDLQELFTQMDVDQTELKKLRKKVGQFESMKNFESADNEELRLRLEAKDQELTKLKTSFDRLEFYINDLKQLRMGAEERLGFEQRLLKAKSKNDKLKQKIENQRVEIATERSKADASQIQIAELQGKIISEGHGDQGYAQKFNAQMRVMAEQLQSRLGESKALKKQRNEVRSRLKKSESQRESIQQELDHEKHERMMIGNELQETHALLEGEQLKLQRSEETRKQLADALQDSYTEVEQTYTELNRVQEELRVSESNLQAMTQERDKIKAEIRDFQNGVQGQNGNEVVALRLALESRSADYSRVFKELQQTQVSLTELASMQSAGAYIVSHSSVANDNLERFGPRNLNDATRYFMTGPNSDGRGHRIELEFPCQISIKRFIFHSTFSRAASYVELRAVGPDDQTVTLHHQVFEDRSNSGLYEIELDEMTDFLRRIQLIVLGTFEGSGFALSQATATGYIR